MRKETKAAVILRGAKEQLDVAEETARSLKAQWELAIAIHGKR